MYWDNSGFGLGRFYIRRVYYGEGISFDLSSDGKQGIRMTAAEHANPFFRELHQIERAGFLEARRTTEGRPDEAVQRESRVDYRLFQGSSSLLQELVQAKELARSAQEDLATKAEKDRS